MPPPRSDAVVPPVRSQFVPVSASPHDGVDAPVTTAATQRVSRSSTADQFSVLNDFRYLTDSDKRMLTEVTGEKIEPGFTDKPGSASAFALQLALDRRTGQLAPHQPVTSVYLKNAAAELDQRNGGRAGFTNPYSGDVMDKAVAWLDAHGKSRADIRL
ncbi:hypothetical protein [Austwickia sp. TVS 96-490-7B]|uniref:hypothetical protein n=1 Tax=Austwickia sp. TVS 96-490-7B TaxID=2830843 RepID=UPI0021028FB0|nr:hypothetical protein [Austwickia sp. TVS 96-490-7B]